MKRAPKLVARGLLLAGLLLVVAIVASLRLWPRREQAAPAGPGAALAELEAADREIASLEAALDRESDAGKLRALVDRLDAAVARAEAAASLTGARPPGDPGLHAVLARLDADTYAIPPAFAARVHELVERYQRDGERDARGRVAQARVWPMITSELAALGVPVELGYIAGIESHWDAYARSSTDAVGLWQFRRSTAQRNGLRVDGDVEDDERLDPVKSTRAAARHLADLLAELGDDAALFAVLAYNNGSGATHTLLVEAGREKDGWRRGHRRFWTLFRLRRLPEEAMSYLPRILAMAIVDERRASAP